MFRKFTFLCALAGAHTIWAQPWTLTKVVDQTTARPDNQGFFNPWGEFPAIEGQWVVFLDGGTGNNTESIWSANLLTNPPTFVKLADTNTPVPGGTGNFVGFTQIVSNNIQVHNGTVLFFGYDSGYNPSDPNCVGGLYTIPVSGGKISLVVNYNTTLPGNGISYCYLTGSASAQGVSIDHGEVVFSAQTYNPNTYANDGVYSAPATANGKGIKLIADRTTVWTANFPTGCQQSNDCWTVDSWFSPFISGSTIAFIGNGGQTGADGLFVNSYTNPILQSPDILPGDNAHNPSFPDDASYFMSTVMDSNNIFYTALDPEYIGTCANGSFSGVFQTVPGSMKSTSVMNTCNTLASGDPIAPNSFNYLAADEGTVAFQVMDQTTGAQLLYSSVNGALSPIIATGDPLPGGSFPVFSLLAQGGVGTDGINGGRVVFEAEGGATTYTNGLYVASLACASAVTSEVSTALGPLVYNSKTKIWSQTATVTNSGKKAISGPLSLVLTNLSSDATLADGNGSTVCFAPAGSPYINLPLPENNKLAPGKVAKATLEFNAPSTGEIKFMSEVAAAGAR